MLVLDEADRLIEMGFKEEVNTIVKACKHSKRQTIMVSATLNQDLKELASMSLKQPLTFTVQQQQRKADLANLKLKQYLVRLKFDDVEEKPVKKFVKKDKKPKWQKKKRNPMDPNFDSEEEYGQEGERRANESSSEGEMDDGKMSNASDGESVNDLDDSMDDLSDLGGDSEMDDEEGEEEMDEDSEV